MDTLQDIRSIDDIKLLVDRFYTAVRQDPVIGPVFEGVIGDQWPVHLDKMYRFWQTILLEEHSYYGAPFPPHARLPIDDRHFGIWLRLWKQTIDGHFSGAIAEEAKWRSDKMAAMFQMKLNYLRQQPSQEG